MASLVSKPKSGKVTLNADGSFVYKPNDSFKGTDSFKYKVSDGEHTTTAKVSVKVGGTSGSSSGSAANAAGADLHSQDDQIPGTQPADALSPWLSDRRLDQSLQTPFDFDERTINDWASLRDWGHDAVSAVDHHDVALLQDVHLLLK